MYIIFSKYLLNTKKNYIPMLHSISWIMTGYYDAILGLIPLTLVGFAGILTLAGLSLTLAVSIGATVSAALIGHAMFVRAPDRVSRSPPGRIEGGD